jgi:phosphatidylglycerophosphate synthase
LWAAVVIAQDRRWPGVALLLSSLLLDAVDGRIAQVSARERVSSRARLLYIDYLIDRMVDVAIGLGLAGALQRSGEPVYLAYLFSIGSLGVSYVRAQGDAFGFESHGGPFERWSRLLLILVGLATDHIVGMLVVVVGVTCITLAARVRRGLVTSRFVLAEGVVVGLEPGEPLSNSSKREDGDQHAEV